MKNTVNLLIEALHWKIARLNDAAAETDKEAAEALQRDAEWCRGKVERLKGKRQPEVDSPERVDYLFRCFEEYLSFKMDLERKGYL